jgi:hypothetical protein
MKLATLNSITAPTAEHLAEARNDLQGLEHTVKLSEAALARAEAALEKTKATEQDLRNRIASAKEDLVTERRQAFLQTSSGEDPGPLFEGAEKIAALQRNLDRSLDYLLLYPQADCTTGVIAAKVAEATARANLYEGQAVYRRLSAILKFAAVAAEDPGTAALFGQSKGPEGGSSFGPDKTTPGSWSDKRLAETDLIMRRDIPDLRKQLESHIVTTEQKRGSLAAGLLWN